MSVPRISRASAPRDSAYAGSGTNVTRGPSPSIVVAMPPKPVGDIRSFFKRTDKSSQEDGSQKDSRVPSDKGIATTPSSRALPSRANFPNIRTATSHITLNKESSSILPSNSQSSLNSNASKKVSHNGENVVLNSDSDSDLDAYEDLDFGLGAWQPRKSPRKSPRKTAPEATKASTLGYSRSCFRRSEDTLPRPPKPTKDTAPALSKLLQAVKRDKEKELKIEAWKAELDKPVEEVRDEEGAVDESDLAAVVDGEDAGDKSKRLYQAMQRTSNQEREVVFHFFGERTGEQRLKIPLFPINSLPNHGWTACFEDSSSRDQSFLSGFAKQVFEYQALPDELATWIIDEICSPRCKSITPRYIDLLESHPKHLEKILEKEKINSMFNAMGADLQCLVKGIQPTEEIIHSPKQPIPPQLKSVLHLLRRTAKWLSPEPRKQTLLILLHLSMDDSVLADVYTLFQVQEAIEEIMRYIPDRSPMLNEVAQSLITSISHPILQNHLVTSLPLKSPMTASFRRHLALSFLIQPTLLPASISDISGPIHTALDHSTYLRINRSTDYASLAAAVSLLDIAIGPGPVEVPCRPPPTDGDSPQNYLTSEEIGFNRHIDVLVQHIRHLGNNIIEAGAISDPSRLAAKGNMDALCHRLENAARIGGRKKRKMFEDEGSGQQAQASKKIFGKWMSRAKERSATPAITVTAEIEGVKSEGS